ncbi:hypothetical protein CEUSTIGMA_g11179.t1 [Chlamydomonas eustigma]|uniref:Uncharacterized protein n=1 Tax=Chlamydomonas eustigma TaxID=1157962 RepID=A0A250XKZ9_9CHLO|nr:hypothetical protein CEUSTIGMA_g11179.t1 [Chlamydomonas eustigma]|eukprot:GAX83754.1 hypothetical protein CEUSTIGMA_g11179.t1 [Chlamydomonas eustigma]
MRRCSGSDEPNDGNKVDLKGHKLRRRLGRGAGLVEEMRQKSLKRAFEACKVPNSDNPGVPQGENESSLDNDLEDMEQDNCFEDLEDEVEERSQLGELHSKQKKEEEDMDKDLEGFITSDEEDAAAQLDPEVREFREQMHGRQRGHAWRQKDSFTHYIRGLLIGMIGLRIPEKDRTRKEAEHEAASKFFEDTLGQYLSIAFSSHWVTQSLSSGLRELLDTLPVIELGGKPDLSCSEEDEVWAKDKAESPPHSRDNGHHGRARINSGHRRSNRQRNALRSPQRKASTKRRRANQGLGSPYYIPRKEEWSASGSDTPHPSDQEFIVSDDHFEDEGEGSDLLTDADEDCVVVGDITKIKRMGKKRREMAAAAAAAAEDALKSSGGLRSRNKKMKLVQGGHQLRGKSGGGACPQRGTSRSSRPRTTRARERIVSTSNDKKNSLPKNRVITKRRVPSSGSQADLDLHPAPHKRRVSSRKHQCSGKRQVRGKLPHCRQVRGKLPHCRQVHAAAKDCSPDPQAAAEGSLSTPHGPYNLRSSHAAAPASQTTHGRPPRSSHGRPPRSSLGRPPRSSQSEVANRKGAVPSESIQCLSADKAIALANESAAAAAVAAAASIKAAAAAKSAASYANACLTSCTLSAAEVHATRKAVAAALSEAQAAESAAAASAAVCVNEERPLECPLTYPQAQPPRVSPLQSSPKTSKVLESLEDSLDGDDNAPSDTGHKILHQRALSPDSANEVIEGQRGAGISRTRVQGRRVLCSDSEDDVHHDKEAEGIMVSPENVSTRSLSIEIPQILPAPRTSCDKHLRSGSKHVVSVNAVKTVHSVGTSSDEEMTPPHPPHLQHHDQPMHPHIEEGGREHVLDYTSEGGHKHLVYYEGKWKGKCGLCNRGRVGVFGHCLWRLMISGHPQDPRTGLQLASYHCPSRSAPVSLQNHHHHTQRRSPTLPLGNGVGRYHHKVAGAVPVSGHRDLEESLHNEVRPPPVHEFYVGRSCGDRVILHHSISHFRARLMAALRRELKRRMDQGYMSTGSSDYAPSVRRTRTRGKRAMKEILEDEQLLSSWLEVYRR